MRKGYPARLTAYTDLVSDTRARRRRVLPWVAAAVVVVLAVGGFFGVQWWQERSHAPVCELRDGESAERTTPEQAANAATIALVARQRDLPSHAVTVALATAIQESKLLNLTYGDADSLGLFQQRPSQGWGSREEILDPVYSAEAFYAALEEVDGWADMAVTVAAQTVQRSAFPEAYADHEQQAEVMATALTGEYPAGVGCALEEPTSAGDPDRLLTKIDRQVGVDAEADGQVVRISAQEPSQAWAIASWSVTHAEAEQITAVTVAGHRWDRANSPLVWEIVSADTTDLTVTLTLN